MRAHATFLLFITILLSPRMFAQWVQLPGIEGGNVSAFLSHGPSLFAATCGGDVYMSRDSGASWSICYSGGINRLSCLAQIGSTVFAGGWDGILRSTDEGTSWSQSDSGFPQPPHVLSLLAYDTLLFATTKAMYPDKEIYFSADMGSHWTPLSPRDPNTGATADGNSASREMYTIARRGDVLCAGSDYLFRSTDGGLTWSPTLHGPYFCTSIVTDTSRFYAANSYGVFYSTDNGESWMLGYAWPDSGQRSGSDVFHLSIRNGVLYAGGASGMVFSPDQGVTWRDLGEIKGYHLNASTMYSRFTAIYATSEHVYVGAEWGGIFRSSDNGGSWIECNKGFHDVDIAALAADNQSVYAVAPHVGLFRSDDNGDSWISLLLPGEGLYFNSVVALGENLFIGGDGGVYRSTDRGWTWAPSGSLGSIGGLYIVDDKLYARGQGVFVSSDSGQSWTAINNGLRNLTTLSFVGHGSTLLVGTGYGGLFFSTDAGGSWAAMDHGYITVVYAERLAMMKDEIYVHTDNYSRGETPRLLRSTDNGATWLGADYGLSLSMNNPIEELHIYDSVVFVVTHDGLALSTNKGASWDYSIYKPSTDADGLYRPTLTSNNRYLFMGGKGILRAPLVNLLTRMDFLGGGDLPTRTLLLQSYPNPFNPTTTIGYALPHRTHVTLIVYNTLGQQVATLVNGDIDAGQHEVEFNASTLASGVYFYRLQTDDFAQTRKVLLVR